MKKLVNKGYWNLSISRSHLNNVNEKYEDNLNPIKSEKTFDYTSNDKFAKDPNNRSSIINFLQNKWISKKDIELIVDDQMRRDRKLQQILN